MEITDQHNVEHNASNIIFDAIASRVRVPILGTGLYSIHPDAVEPIADMLQATIANVIASLLDAGSERDAVMENEELSAALCNEIRGWVAE